MIDIKINNADFSVSTGATSTDLIRVEPQQAKVQAAFTGADTSLTAASNAYLINVINDNAASKSTLQASFAGATLNRLVNKAASTTLGVSLSNAMT